MLLTLGGGAPGGAGEDRSVCNGLRQVRDEDTHRLPVTIGREILRPSTWFNGYTEKFFYDRGVLFAHLYGMAAGLMAVRYILVKESNVQGDKRAPMLIS